MVRSPSFNVALTFILVLYVQILEAKTKIARCPIGFEETYSKYDDDPICYKLKGPETFADKFEDCAGNLFTIKLFQRLNLTKPNVSIWTDYKSLYSGGLFVDWSYTDSMGYVLETTYEVNRDPSYSVDEELCVIMDPITNFTAVKCDDQHFRYCFVKEYSDDLDSDSSCNDLTEGRRFRSPLPICLSAVKGQGGGNIRATWEQAKRLCNDRKGSLLSRGWRYSNNPNLASPTANPEYPLGFIMDDKNTLLRYNSNEVVPPSDWHFADTFNHSTSYYVAVANDFWYLVNSSRTFFHAICESPVYLRHVELNVTVDEENKIILTVSDGTLDDDKIHCFTDSSSLYPQKVTKTKNNSQTYILKPKEDGYYWCTHSDSKNFYISESKKALYVQVKETTINLYAIKIRFFEKYSLDRIGKLLEYAWKEKIKEYVFYSTIYFQNEKNQSAYDNYTIMEFRNTHYSSLYIQYLKKEKEKKSIIQNMKLKRLFLDARSALLQVELHPDMKPVRPGQWEDMQVEFMRPVFYCEDTVRPRLVLGDRLATSSCREYRCIGDFNEGVTLIETLREECATAAEAVTANVIIGLLPSPVSTADPLSSVTPDLTKNLHLTELQSSSSEEDFSGVLISPRLMARQIDGNGNDTTSPIVSTELENTTNSVNSTDSGNSTADSGFTVDTDNSTAYSGDDSTADPTTDSNTDPANSTPEVTEEGLPGETGGSTPWETEETTPEDPGGSTPSETEGSTPEEAGGSSPAETAGSTPGEPMESSPYVSGESNSAETTDSTPEITQDTEGTASESFPSPTRPPPTDPPLTDPPPTEPPPTEPPPTEPPPSSTASPVTTDLPPPPLQTVPGICLWPPCTVAPLPTVPPPSTAYPEFPSTAIPTTPTILPITEKRLIGTWVRPPWTSLRPFQSTVPPPSTAEPVFSSTAAVPVYSSTALPVPTTTENPEEQLQQVITSLETLLTDETAEISVEEIDSTFTMVDELLSDNEELEIGSLLHLLDQVGTRLSLNGSDNVAAVRDNVALLVAETRPNAPVRGLRIAVRDTDQFTDGAFEIIRDKINSTHLSSDESEVVVSLPASISTTDRRVSFVVFRNDRAFQASQHLYSVNSRILSVNVEDVTHFQDGEVIDIHLNPLTRNISAVNQTRSCAFWQFLNATDGSGYWSQEGCNFIPATEEGTLDICRCNHLTHFAEVLVPRTDFSERNEFALEIISIVGHCLSIFGILLVALTAVIFRSWRRDFSNKIWLQLCCAILLLSVGFLTVTFARFTEYSVGCMIVGVLVHYATLASFCWMVVAGVVSYRRLVKVFARDGTHKLLRAAVFAWGTPAGIVGVLLASSPLAYSGRMDEREDIHTISFCYPTGLALWLAVYTPIAIMVLINWILFILIVRSVFASKRIQRHGDSNEALRCASVSCLLVFLFGLPWIFGLFAMNIVAAYLFTILAGFQGFVLFLFFVCGNKKTRDLWLNKLKIKQTRKVPVTSSTYTNRSTAAGPGGNAPGLGGSKTGLNGAKSGSLEEKESRPRSLNSSDDSRFS